MVSANGQLGQTFVAGASVLARATGTGTVEHGVISFFRHRIAAFKCREDAGMELVIPIAYGQSKKSAARECRRLTNGCPSLYCPRIPTPPHPWSPGRTP